MCVCVLLSCPIYFYNLQEKNCIDGLLQLGETCVFMGVLFPTVHVVKGGVWDAWVQTLTVLQLCRVLREPCFPGEHVRPRPAFLRAVLQGLVFVLSVWMTDPESWQLCCLKGQNTLIPQQNTAAVLAAFSAATTGEGCPCPLCQLWAPEIFPLADCDNASKLLSAWIISEMVGKFLTLALILVIATLSLALEINTFVSWLFVFIGLLFIVWVCLKCSGLAQQCYHFALQDWDWTEAISYQYNKTVSSPSKPVEQTVV